MAIKVVFFDFYNTLVKFWPPLESIQKEACSKFGLEVREEDLVLGYKYADVYFNEENDRSPLGNRDKLQRDEFFTEYERLILHHSGLDVSPQLASDIWKQAIQIPKEFVVFNDTLHCLKLLKSRGLDIGIITNLRQDMECLLNKLNLFEYVDICINSKDVGFEKPDPRIFEYALKQQGVNASDTVHVGDQYYSDVQGALRAGIKPVLLDRDLWHSGVGDCFVIQSLSEIESVLEN
tara:strand:- start:858 stop:1562 length:705 start_codon:yes stop_codon:yes gene_type:complete